MLIDIFQLKFIKVVNGIIHIGAHDCEERIKYLSRFSEVTDDDIIWIDALKHKVDEIQAKNSSIRIYNECIGDNDDESVIFKVTNNFQSSSFLSLKEHLIEHPDIHEIAQIEMKTKTLKTFYDENNLKYDKYNFMVLDIQGAELLALKGAAEILNTVDYIYIEVNTKELYESCALLPEIDEYLSTFGFTRDNILMTEHGWGDAFYTKHIHNLINPIKITYGTDYSNIDITDISMQKCIQNNIIHIPNDDQERNILFGDPLPGIKKYVFIVSGNTTYTIDYYDYVNIDIKNNKLYINEAVPIHIPEISEYKILKYQYTFAIMAIFKNETMVLKTWLEHYIWQCVDHFYLIDNGSTDEPLTILQSYIDKGLVTYYYRPERFCQAQHYRYIFDSENLKDCCKWLCICDLDEFFFGTEQPLAKELDNFDNYDVINTHSFFYGSDGLIDQPEDIRTAIVHRTDDIVNGNKYIFKPSSVKDSSEVWIHWLVEPGTYQKKNGINSTDNDTKIRLNHYVVQSLEYFQEVKMTRGDVSVSQNENIRTLDVFNYYTQAATIRDDILKHIIENNYIKPREEIIHLKYDCDNSNRQDDMPNFSIENMEYKIYKQENVINYKYDHLNPGITIHKFENILSRNNVQVYIILDCPGDDAFAHWVFETFIFFSLFEKINKMYTNVKILTSNNKKYVANLLKFIGMNNEIVYKIDNHDNICFIPPLMSLNRGFDAERYKWGIYNFINTVEQNTITFKNKTNILFLPRNIKDNYGHNGLYEDRRDSNEVNYITDGVIKNGGSVLNTYEINDFSYQFSIICNSKNVILDYGSSFLVNGIVCKEQNIIVLNKHWKSNNHIIMQCDNIIYEIQKASNNVIILNEYECYEDIAKHFI